MRTGYKVGDWLELKAAGELVHIQGKSLSEDILTLRVGERERQFHTDIMTVTVTMEAPSVGALYVDADNELFLRTAHGWYTLDDRMFVSDHYPSRPMKPFDPEEETE